MFSQTTLLGRLGANPEIRTTANGKKVATFRLATTEYVKGKTQTEWHTIVCWEGTAEVAEKHLHKGDLILITGANRTRTWEQDGKTRSATDIVMAPSDRIQFVSVKGKKEGEGHPPTETNDEVPF